MATSNPLIGTTWTQVAATDDEFTLGLQANDGTGNLLAVAVTADKLVTVTGRVRAFE